MNWTVYCMGDLPIFRDVINAVAMVFNSSLFDPSQGAGLVFLAMLISLFLFAFPAITGKPLSPFPLIFVVMLYFGGIVPKTTLQIEDMYLGTVTTVDNVPLIVAVPASIAASISKGITDNVETAFSSPSQGTYLSLGAEGYVNPLKTLMSLRNMSAASPSAGGGDVSFFSANVQKFVSDCAINAPGYSKQAMNTAPDVIGYLTALPVQGLTTYFDATHTQGYLISCPNSAAQLSTDASALTSGSPSPLDNVINSFVPPRNNSAGGVTSMQAAYDMITSQLLANSQNAQMFMGNMLANIPVRQGVTCATAATSGDVATCNAAMMVQVGIEQNNIDAAANASIFAKTAIPLMNILLALFYAFSPIVLGVALMSAAHGLKILSGFLMFGAWTQSWMPISAILNYMVQEQVQYEMSKLGSAGVTLANTNDFYSAVAMKVGLASELMAMTPMISMALLSGSMMALSSVAGKFSQDRVDEKALAPNAMQTDALTHKSNHRMQTADHTHGSSDGSGNADMDVNANNDVYGTMNEGSAMQANLTKSKAHSTTAAHNRDEAIANALKNARGSNRETAFMQGVSAKTSDDVKNEVAQARDEVISRADYNSLDAQDKAALDASIGFKMAGNGVAASQALSTMSAKGQRLAHQVQEGFKAGKVHSFSESAQRNFDKALKTAASTSLGNEDSDAVKNAVSAAEQAQEQEQAAETLSHQFGATTSRHTTAVAAQFLNAKGGEAGANAAIDAAKAKMTKEQREAVDAEEKRMDRIGDAAGMRQTAGGRIAARLKAMMNVAGGDALKLLSDAGLADDPAGSQDYQDGKEHVEAENAPLQQAAQAASDKVDKRTKNSAKNAHAAAHLKGSGGANAALVEGFTQVANRRINEGQGAAANGTLGMEWRKDFNKLQQQYKDDFVADGYRNGYTDEHGNASMGNNLGRGVDQITDFAHDHPVITAAAAITAIAATAGGAALLGEAAATAEAATAAATEAEAAEAGLATAESEAAAATGEQAAAAEARVAAAREAQKAAAERAKEAIKAAAEAAKKVKKAQKVVMAGGSVTAALGVGAVNSPSDSR